MRAESRQDKADNHGLRSFFTEAMMLDTSALLKNLIGRACVSTGGVVTLSVSPLPFYRSASLLRILPTTLPKGAAIGQQSSASAEGGWASAE